MLRVLGLCCLGRIRYSSLLSRALLKGLTRPQPGLKFALPSEVQTTIPRFAQPVFWPPDVTRGTERTRLPAVDEQGEQRYFRGTTTSRPLDCSLSPLHHGSIHSLNSAPHQTTSARSAKSSSPACKRLVAGHWPRGSGGGPSPAATSFSSPFRPAQTTSSCFEWTPTLS